MTVSVLASALLQQADPLAFPQQLYRRDTSNPATETATEPDTTLATGSLSTDPTSEQNLFADLNATRIQQYGVTYGAGGTASRSTANTILVGYG